MKFGTKSKNIAKNTYFYAKTTKISVLLSKAILKIFNYTLHNKKNSL